MAFFVSSFDNFLPHFAATVANMSHSESSAPAIVAAAQPNLSVVRLDSYNDTNVESWISSHPTHFYVNRVTKSVYKFNAVRAALPRCITDVYGHKLDLCGRGEEPYGDICAFLVSRFSRNKWFSYF